MSEPTLLDETYSIIINGFVETGQAPHRFAVGPAGSIPKVQDGRIESMYPEGIIGFVALPSPDG